MQPPPKKSTGREVTEAVVKGAAGMVPIAGSPIAEALALAMGWAYNRRLGLWMEELAEAVDALQQRADGRTFEQLAEDDVFVDAVVAASRAAAATHQAEKLQALRNGVLHCLDPNAPSADEQARFFRLVDEFTASHLRLLHFLHDPAASFTPENPDPQFAMGGRGSLLEAAYPEFRGKREWYDLLARDLTDAGLTNGGGMHVTMSGHGLYTPGTSPMGERFLAFISDNEQPARGHGQGV